MAKYREVTAYRYDNMHNYEVIYADNNGLHIMALDSKRNVFVCTACGDRLTVPKETMDDLLRDHYQRKEVY